MTFRLITGNIPTLIRSSPREAVLIGLSVLILFFLTGFSFWLTQRVLMDFETADRLNRFNARLTEFVQSLRTVESSQRGYLLTGSPEFLQPYYDINGRLEPLGKELEASTPKELQRNASLSGIPQLLSAKLSEMESTISLWNAGQKDVAIARVKDGYGLNLTSRIEEVVTKVRDQASTLLANNERATTDLQTVKVFIDGIGAVLVITLSILSLLLLMRSNMAMREAQGALEKANQDLEDTVAQRTAALRRANEEVQRFAYIVSHDLRSPLVNIMGFTSELETLRKELFEKLAQADGTANSDALGKDFDEAFGFIKSSIGRMDRLIAAILRISREGNRPINPEDVDCKTLVETIVSGIAHQIRGKEADVQIGALPHVTTDRLALEQIFANLIENAVKFLKPDEKGEIRVDAASRGADIAFSVVDNGRGIDPKDHQRIFELFRRSGRQDVPGEGMGLAYVTTLVRKLGGTITVESDLGRGSTFTITLPRTLRLQNRKAA